MDKLFDRSKEIDFLHYCESPVHDATSVIQKTIRNVENSHFRITEVLLFDLFKKEIDQTIEDKIFLPEKMKEKNLSIFLFDNKNITFDNSDINNISYTFYLPTIIGFINNDTKQLYILDSMKSIFCSRNFCKEKSCLECNDFLYDMNKVFIARQLTNKINK